MSPSELDLAMTRRACELAIRGRFAVEPNPCVGAVIVAGGRIVGEGWHRRYGAAHAEVEAIAAAGPAAKGATLYVSLEPCSTTGKTPPCVDAILAAGIGRVVYAVDDPNPRHAGRARAMLGSAGVEVVASLAPGEGSRLLRRFTRHLARSRPWVIAKWAMSLDGKIATRTGDSKWISNEASRARVHELRGHVDGIAVGVGTVRSDSPRLTARPAGPRVARRIVFDRRCETPVDWPALRDGGPDVVILAGAESDERRRAALAAAGARVVEVDANGRLEHVIESMRVLEGMGVKRLLVEGGARLLGAAFDARLVDQVSVFLAPVVIGGSGAPAAVDGEGVAAIHEAMRLHQADSRRVAAGPGIGDDVEIEGFCEPE